ncbi:hypothetical protein BDA96_04G269300 [Sorghum bicolor]|uniref:Uncharacterized protein n=1 Tax=Sorghum bicolor TaxID=4558 RepID=A0A921R667_SORBI|nr:hypothetical protein BDA96_04G269300 [Sorghum bicolor]
MRPSLEDMEILSGSLWILNHKNEGENSQKMVHDQRFRGKEDGCLFFLGFLCF